MKSSIRVVAVFSTVLIVILLLNLSYIQVIRANELAHHPRNSRQFMENQTIQRGQISAGGQVLAQSVPTAEGASTFQRTYPYEPMTYGAVVGYLSPNMGAAGMELSQNAILTGEDDSLAATRLWDSITGKKQRGANVELTLQPSVQRTAFEQLSSRGYAGSVVAIRPSTGEVLAMASTPTFNPQEIANPDREASNAAFEAYANDSDGALLNRATQQTQPPGSTFKVLTTAAALEQGATFDTPVTAEPNIVLPGTEVTLENYNGQRCGTGAPTTTLREAFRLSCNAPFVELSTQAGADALRSVAEGFGVGESFEQLGLPVQPSTIGPIPDDAALGQTSIGQRDVAFTPLQNAVIAATIANGGQRMEPHLIKQITGPDLKPLRVTRPVSAGRAVSEPVAQQLRELMIASEQHGAGEAGIASKTGTAEHGENSRGSAPHAWYIAFSLSADVAVAVLVENGGDMGQAATGNTVAGPIGRAVIRAAEQEQR